MSEAMYIYPNGLLHVFLNKCLTVMCLATNKQTSQPTKWTNALV